MVALHGVDKTPHAVCLVFETSKWREGRVRAKDQPIRLIFVCRVKPEFIRVISFFYCQASNNVALHKTFF